tara:strand:- start:35549 stop:36283 length:735 start_codon:yes stop_codon:yes gene_type:complete
MRIINGRDYYDLAQAHGQDQSTVFVREKQRLIDQKSWKSIPRLQMPGLTIPLDMGKRHFIKHLTHPLKVAQCVLVARPCKVWLADCCWQGIAFDNLTANTRQYVWDWLDFNKCINEHNLVFKNSNYAYLNMPTVSPEWFQSQALDQDFMSYMIAHKIVIMTCDTEPSHQYNAPFRLQANGWNLGNMEFYRALPGFEAFQRIEQWISGVLPENQNPTVEITDNMRAAKHGFDKWSFRKPGVNSKI